MSFLKDLMGEVGVPGVEKKLPVKSRYINSPFATKPPLEPVDPEKVLRERFGIRKEVYLNPTDFDAMLRSQIPDDIRLRPGRRK